MTRLFKITFLILSVCSSFQPKDARAGAIAGVISGSPGRGALIGLAIGTTFGFGAGGIMTAASAMNDRFYGTKDLLMNVAIGGVVAGVAGGILDIDSSLNLELLEQSLKERYPFLNNPEVLGELASSIKSKLVLLAKQNPTASCVFTSLHREELSEILAGAQISSSQFEIIAQDLE